MKNDSNVSNSSIDLTITLDLSIINRNAIRFFEASKLIIIFLGKQYKKTKQGKVGRGLAFV